MGYKYFSNELVQMSEQGEKNSVQLLIEGLREINGEVKEYHANHEDKNPPAYYEITKGRFPFKRKILRVYVKPNSIEVESKYFTEEHLKRVFAKLEPRAKLEGTPLNYKF
jgi:hypothetical protein